MSSAESNHPAPIAAGRCPRCGDPWTDHSGIEDPICPQPPYCDVQGCRGRWAPDTPHDRCRNARTETLAHGRKHSICPTCSCDNRKIIHLGVYPPNEILYGHCSDCGQVRWGTSKSRWGRNGWETTPSEHCACCTHPHDLEPGGHDLPQESR